MDGQYDVIWGRGSFCADLYQHDESQRDPGAVSDRPADTGELTEWLHQIEAVAAPGCDVVLCPFWQNDGYRRRCVDVMLAVFTQVLLRNGYTVLPVIEGHNHEPEFPVTFYKKIYHEKTLTN